MSSNLSSGKHDAPAPAEYPSAQRQGCGYSIRFIKSLLASDALRDIGSDAVLLAIYIASREDRLHYAKPPSFWRGELMDRFGIRSPKDFIRIRKKAIEAGLLHHVEGTRTSPGLYWTTVPQWMEPKMRPVPKTERVDSIRSQNGTGEGTANGTAKGTAKGTLSITHDPTPSTPKKEVRGSSDSDGPPVELSSWIDSWNQWQGMGLVASTVSASPSKALTQAWLKCQRSAELRGLLRDRDAIRAAIERSDFVRGGWFRLERLLAGQNKAGEYIVRVLLDGGYADRTPSAKRQANVGPGVTFDPNRKYTNAF